MKPLAGKVALVTGGGRGLGAALCGAIADAGATVTVGDLDAGRARAVAERLTARGAIAQPDAFDVSDEAACDAAVERLQGHFDRCDILINNAGVDYTLPLEEISVRQWDQVLATNLRGPFLLARRVAPLMKRAGGGHIVNICSTAAKRTWPNAAAYHASKWGLLGLSHALHAELRPHAIKVTAVITGGMRTPFLLDRFPDLDPAVLQEPEHVAAVVRDLLCLPGQSVVAEVTVVPLRETSWP